MIELVLRCGADRPPVVVARGASGAGRAHFRHHKLRLELAAARQHGLARIAHAVHALEVVEPCAATKKHGAASGVVVLGRKILGKWEVGA